MSFIVFVTQPLDNVGDMMRHRHLKSRLHHTANGSDGVPGVAVVEKFDKPALSVAHFDIPDRPLTKVILCNRALNESIAAVGGVADVPLQSNVLLQQLLHSDVRCRLVDSQRRINDHLRFLLPKLLQRRCVNAVAFTIRVRVAVIIGAVLALKLARSQNASFAVFAFGCILLF